MRTFLVRLERFSTMEECENGAHYKKAKNVLVQCETFADVEKTVDKGGYEIASVKDWDALRQVQTMANIKWIMDH